MKATVTAFWGVAVLLVMMFSSQALAAGEFIERVETYAISGQSGIELYRSIGERGPKSSVGRAIAHTTFKLTWRRNYQPQGDGSCKLVSAIPRLIITYTLPKPTGSLPPETKRRWDVFLEGIKRHEQVHGVHMKEMVAEIEANTIGVAAPDDPGCQKVRQHIQAPLGAASMRQRQRSRDFDRQEMASGANMHRLVLGLVNGE
ncbi:DUF922 domain-containing Zn-dependent protease [Aquamicrobium segne]|uniref:DUF922 domain-containing Zn-dependent protease n=1 Tax=Aquamicrobium segne TaxID=469547 RepID=A0ABW0GVI2_9HYPH